LVFPQLCNLSKNEWKASRPSSGGFF